MFPWFRSIAGRLLAMGRELRKLTWRQYIAAVAAFALGILVGRFGQDVFRPSRATHRMRAAAALTGFNALWGDTRVRIEELKPIARQLALFGPEATPELLSALHRRSEALRNVAALALGELGGQEAIDGLLNAPKHSPAPITAALAEALAIAGKPAIATLQEAVRDRNPDIQLVAIEALARMRDEKVIEFLRDLGDRRAVPELVLCLQDPSGRVRTLACFALGDIGDPRAVASLTKCLDDDSAEMRQAACRALADIGDPAAVPSLTKMLAPDSGAVLPAAQALASMGDAKAKGVAANALAKVMRAPEAGAAPDMTGLMETAEVLVSLGEAGLTELRELLRSENEYIAGAAAYGLVEAGDVSALPALATAPGERHGGCMAAAAFAGICQREPDEVARMLRDRTASADTRRDLARAVYDAVVMERLRPAAPIMEALRDAAQTDPDRSVRQAARRALEELAPPNAP